MRRARYAGAAGKNFLSEAYFGIIRQRSTPEREQVAHLGRSDRRLPRPARGVRVPLSQHIGAPAVPAVEAGERVLRGQLLAKKAEGLSANVYSPVAGVVKGVVGHIAGGGKKVDHILVESDGTDESVSLPPLSEITPESVLARIEEAGIVGRS